MNLIQNSFRMGVLNHQNLDVVEPTELYYMLLSPSLSASGEDVHVSSKILYWCVAFYSKCQSVIYENKKSLQILSIPNILSYVEAAEIASVGLPTGSQSRSQKLQAENRLFSCL